MPGKVEPWRVVSNRMYYHHDSMKWKHKDDTCIRVIGVTEFNADTVNGEWMLKIVRALEKGYAATRKGPWLNVLQFICRHNPVAQIPIGYVGRQSIGVPFPASAPYSSFRDELNTLAAIEFEGNIRPFGTSTIHDYGMKWVQISGRNKSTQEFAGKGIPPKATMTRVRRVVEQQLATTLSSREPVLDWLHSAEPIIRIPFASHTKDWVHRS